MSVGPRTASFVIYDDADIEHLSQLRQAAEAEKRREHASDSSPLTIGDTVESDTSAREAYDDAVRAAAGRATEVRLQSIGRRRFRDLLAEHPPRERVDEVEITEDGETRTEKSKGVHPDDSPYGVNVEKFAPALLAYRDGDVRTVVGPEFGSAADLGRFLDDELSDGDFEQAWLTAWALNRGQSIDPKATLYSTETRRSAEI